MLTVTCSSRAECDIAEIADYIGKHDPESAVRVLDSLESTFAKLAEIPYLGIHPDYLTRPQDAHVQNKVMVTLFGLFAEIERDLISERTKEGLAAAKAKRQTPGPSKGIERQIEAGWQGTGDPNALGQKGFEGLYCQNRGVFSVDLTPLCSLQKGKSKALSESQAVSA